MLMVNGGVDDGGNGDSHVDGGDDGFNGDDDAVGGGAGDGGRGDNGGGGGDGGGYGDGGGRVMVTLNVPAWGATGRLRSPRLAGNEYPWVLIFVTFSMYVRKMK